MEIEVMVVMVQTGVMVRRGAAVTGRLHHRFAR